MRSGEWALGAFLITLMCAPLMGLGGCHKMSAAPEPAAGATAQVGALSKPEQQEPGAVSLTPEQIEKIGLKTVAAGATEFSDEAIGYGSVISHDSIAQVLTELLTARAAEKQSRAALARARRLSGTVGALSADSEEAGARQAEVDAAALALARERLSAMFGLRPPWRDGGNMALLQGLADGNPQLVRITFPLGTLPADTPKSLHAARIDSGPAQRWKMTTVWGAPAEANLPGRSFFAILKGAEVGEGERILAWAPIGTAETGVVIPQSAVVINDGRYWCYLEEKAGTYVRTQIDAHRPFENGYFLSEGVKAGDRVVIKGAAQLLAQESNSGGDAD